MPTDALWLCWQGTRGQSLAGVVADARGLFADRYGIAPAETLVPLTASAPGTRPVEWLHYRDTRWHVAVGPVPTLGWNARPVPGGPYTQEVML